MQPDSIPLYYTRCPVPTASGIAFHRRMFESAFSDGKFCVRELNELGPDHLDAHYTHSIEHFFREGGGAPPMWAKSRGVDSVLLGITFMEERLGIYVRADDGIGGVEGLAGKRLALPVWPRLVFNFWRFAAEKGFCSALAAHGLAPDSVTFVDVEEGWDPHQRRQVGRAEATVAARCEYREQLHALVDGRVDAIFGKGPEAALLEQEGAGRIRLLFDLRDAPSLAHRVNNSTPRLFTTSRALLEAHPDAVSSYLATALDAASWAQGHPDEARTLLARECAVPPRLLDNYLQSDYLTCLRPRFEPNLIEAAEVMKTFLLKRGYLEHDFDLPAWCQPGILEEAQNVAARVSH